jgi:hypothetical protein
VNFWNFPEGLCLNVKVQIFSPHAPHGHELSLAEDRIEWNIEIIKVFIYTQNFVNKNCYLFNIDHCSVMCFLMLFR